MQTMEKLPDLALLAIFEHLGIQSLATCRLVSKRFKYFADLTKPNEIAVNELKILGDKWRFRDELIDPDSQINNYDMDVLMKIPFDLRALRRLKVWNYALYKEQDSLVRFLSESTSQLEHLEIVGLYLKENAMLSLPRLKVLFIDWPEGKCAITVNAPELLVLSFFGSYGSLAKISITCPTTVKHLELFDRADEAIRQFENVETLRVFLPRFIDPDLLRSNRNLKEIYLLGQSEWDLLLIDQTRTIVDDLLEQKRRATKSELKIFFFDQLLGDGKQFDDYQFHLRFTDYFFQSESDDDV